MTLTQTLALLIGLYMIAGGIALLREGATYVGVIKIFRENAALGYLAGVVTFAIGGALVALHNDWSTLLSSVISLVGWAALIEGFLLIALRDPFMKTFEKIAFTDGVIKGFGIGTLLLGAVLLYCGWQ